MPVPDDTSVHSLGLSPFLSKRLATDHGFPTAGDLRAYAGRMQREGREPIPLAIALSFLSGVDPTAARLIAVAVDGAPPLAPTLYGPAHDPQICDPDGTLAPAKPPRKAKGGKGKPDGPTPAEAAPVWDDAMANAERMDAEGPADDT